MHDSSIRAAKEQIQLSIDNKVDYIVFSNTVGLSDWKELYYAAKEADIPVIAIDGIPLHLKWRMNI